MDGLGHPGLAATTNGVVVLGDFGAFRLAFLGPFQADDGDVVLVSSGDLCSFRVKVLLGCDEMGRLLGDGLCDGGAQGPQKGLEFSPFLRKGAAYGHDEAVEGLRCWGGRWRSSGSGSSSSSRRSSARSSGGHCGRVRRSDKEGRGDSSPMVIHGVIEELNWRQLMVRETGKLEQ